MCTCSDPGTNREQSWQRKRLEGVVSEGPEGFSVDWKKYWQNWGLTYDPELHRAFQNLLVEKGVLSENPDGNFLVIVRPLGWGQPSLVAIGPLTGSAISARTVLFFTKLEYAQKWAEVWPGFKDDGECVCHIVQMNLWVQIHGSAVLVSSGAPL